MNYKHSLSENELPFGSSFPGKGFPSDALTSTIPDLTSQVHRRSIYRVGGSSKLGDFVLPAVPEHSLTDPSMQPYANPSLSFSSIHNWQFPTVQPSFQAPGYYGSNFGRLNVRNNAFGSTAHHHQPSLQNLEDLLNDRSLEQSKIPFVRKHSAAREHESEIYPKRVKTETNQNVVDYEYNTSHLSNLSRLLNANESELGKGNFATIGSGLENVSSGERWTKLEESVCLHLVEPLVQQELKIICLAANYLGVKRKKRAIDHKLKRLVGFVNWKERNFDDIIQKSRDAISKEPGYALPQDTLDKIRKAALMFRT
eukprot:augustus_masked-scaffold_37-processed-gene-2.26-mRNA-1 protein AED:0.22 eAED:1.00 QI:0/-1/0/1/-1/1/1/0/311